MVADQLTEDELLERWRFDYARALQYTPAEAWLIAKDDSVDLHDLERLIEGGCSRELARRIV